jgi:hypothetical protein
MKEEIYFSASVEETTLTEFFDGCFAMFALITWLTAWIMLTVTAPVMNVTSTMANVVTSEELAVDWTNTTLDSNKMMQTPDQLQRQSER